MPLLIACQLPRVISIFKIKQQLLLNYAFELCRILVHKLSKNKCHPFSVRLEAYFGKLVISFSNRNVIAQESG